MPTVIELNIGRIQMNENSKWEFKSLSEIIDLIEIEEVRVAFKTLLFKINADLAAPLNNEIANLKKENRALKTEIANLKSNQNR